MKTLFHVGYQKCASTFLQLVLFEHHPSIHFAKDEQLRSDVVMAPYAHYERGRVHALLESEKERATACGKSVLVLSNENALTRAGIDAGIVAERLHDLDPNGRVLIVIRNQYSYLASSHTQWLATGKTSNPSLTSWISEMRDSNASNTYLDKADFHSQITVFDNLYGREQVGVFLLEDLSADPGRFLDALTGFIGIGTQGIRSFLDQDHKDSETKKRPKMGRSSRWSILVRTNPQAARIERLLRPIVPEWTRRAIGRVTGLSNPHNKAHDDRLTAQIAEWYAPGNRLLAERLGRDLKCLGYSV